MLTEAIIFLFLYMALIITDLVPVYKAKEKKAIVVCTSIFTVAFILQSLITVDVKLPRYADILEGLLKIITGYSGGQ